MQQLIAKEIECDEADHVSYEIPWIIPNWREVRQDVDLVNDQKAFFETGQEPTQMIQTKWLVGLRDVGYEYDYDRGMARVYLQLLDIKGSGSEQKLDAKVCIQLCDPSGYPNFVDEVERNKEVSLGAIFEGRAFLELGTNAVYEDDQCINPNGEVQYIFILTLKKPAVDSTRFKKLKLEKFAKRSHHQLRQNLATLLNDDSKGDLKIVTSDGVELRAYQSILKVQCPVFAGMFNCDLSESKTGMVKVKDICGKTMKILLHYFYTGDLLTGWSDQDTILEFTYAAGKYQITQVLELLDDLLGSGEQDEDELSNLDVQLLNLAGKLSLKNAEARLLQRISGKLAVAKSSKELFKLFGCDSDEIYRKAGKLAKEQIGESKVFEILDIVFGNCVRKVNFSNRGFIVLAYVQRNGLLRNLEKVLLKQVAEVTSRFTTAEELFAFFGDGK